MKTSYKPNGLYEGAKLKLTQPAPKKCRNLSRWREICTLQSEEKARRQRIQNLIYISSIDIVMETESRLGLAEAGECLPVSKSFFR